jgi:MFS family permease
MSTIAPIFRPERRGVATRVGPLAGGVLVDHLGWQWIFFVNVPVGIIGLAPAETSR